MPGGAPGLQNQCRAEKVLGGFDSHSPPPFFRLRISDCRLRIARDARHESAIINPQSEIE